MTTVAGNFGTVFPVGGRPAVLPAVGENVDLTVGFLPFNVYVSKRSATGWTFGTRPAHSDYPGWISFAYSRSAEGRMNLQVRGYVPDYSLAALSCGAIGPVCFAFRKRIYRAIAINTWLPFAKNLRAQAW